MPAGNANEEQTAWAIAAENGGQGLRFELPIQPRGFLAIHTSLAILLWAPAPERSSLDRLRLEPLQQVVDDLTTMLEFLAG